MSHVQERPKLAVLDANFYWSEQLFSACFSSFDVLLIKPIDFRAFKKRHGHYKTDLKPRPIAKNIWEQRICCPPGWLFHYWSLTQLLLKQAIQRFSQNSPLVFAFCYPHYASLAKAIGDYSIYYAFDDYQDYWPKHKHLIATAEQQAVALADLTLCTADFRRQYLSATYPAYANRMVHIPHGCSQQFMAEDVLDLPRNLPASIDSLERPIAGYVGTLGFRFDFNFLAQVAVELPHITFVLGGTPPVETDGSVSWWAGVRRCQTLPNIHFIGRVPHERLGEYLQSFDVQLMLYSECGFNTNACPTKLWDYMGTSRPIVANAAVPEVLLWTEVLHVAGRPQQYVKAISQALEKPMWKSAERMAIAKANTWQRQAARLQEQINPTLRALAPGS